MRVLCRISSFARTGTLAVAALLLAALAGCASFKDWRHLPADAADTRRIAVVSHGWHTGVVLERADLGDELGFLDAHLPRRPYYEFGWGDADYYQADTPTVLLALKAVFGINSSVVHVAALPGAPEDYFGSSQSLHLTVSTHGLAELRSRLRASLSLTPVGAPTPLKSGLYADSRFFRAEGSYHAFNTCNKWTAGLLDAAGAPVDAVFTVTASGVMAQAEAARRRFPAPAEAAAGPTAGPPR